MASSVHKSKRNSSYKHFLVQLQILETSVGKKNTEKCGCRFNKTGCDSTLILSTRTLHCPLESQPCPKRSSQTDNSKTHWLSKSVMIRFELTKNKEVNLAWYLLYYNPRECPYDPASKVIVKAFSLFPAFSLLFKAIDPLGFFPLASEPLVFELRRPLCWQKTLKHI